MSSTAQGFGEQRLPAGAPAALPEPAPLSVGAEPASLAPPFVLGEPPLPFGAPPGPSSTQAPDAQRPSHASRFTVTRSGPQTTSSLSSQKAPPGQSRSQPGAIVAQFARVESQSSPRTQVSATTQTPPLHSRMLESAAAAHRRSPSSEHASPEPPPASPPLPIAASPPLPVGAAPAAPASPLFGFVAKLRPPAPKLVEPPVDDGVVVQVLVSRPVGFSAAREGAANQRGAGETREQNSRLDAVVHRSPCGEVETTRDAVSIGRQLRLVALEASRRQ